jgi:hypothetical protein
MSLLTITINDPTQPSKSAEVAYCLRVLDEVKKEIGRGNGYTTSGTILSTSAAGVANSSLGSWTYTSSATKA